MRYKKNITVLIATFIAIAGSKAQCTGMLDSVKNEVLRINKVFDSARYLGFDMNVLYYTDTCGVGCSSTDAKTISYQLNAKNYYYNAGNTEFMQNDSFVVSIDHDDKQMIVTRSANNDVAAAFALKDFVNYSLSVYDTLFQICIINTDSATRKISFAATNPLSPYTFLMVSYDIETHRPLLITAKLTEPVIVQSGTPGGPIPPHTDTLHQSLSMQFQNYRSIPTGKIFNQAEYFVKELNKKRYFPVDKYKYYEFITTGMDEDELEDNPVSN